MPASSSRLNPALNTALPALQPPHSRLNFVTTPLRFWHLLSLDAPTIAALWTWFIAGTCKVHLPLASPLAMFIAVWMLYAADRLLDARMLDSFPLNTASLEARHLFHHRHRTAFLTGIGISSLALAALLPLMPAEAIHLYLILGGLTFGYFIVIHITGSAHRLPKEFAVGLCFAAAAFIPTVARHPSLRLPLLIPALLFGSVSTLNCLFIYAWEHPPGRRIHPPPHAATRLALNHLPLLATLLVVSSAALAPVNRNAFWPIPMATGLSAILLLIVHFRRNHIAALTLRALADLALLTPVLLIPFLRR